MAWSGFGQTHLVQKQSWCAGIIWPGFCQEATGPLPVPDFQTKFRSSTDVTDNIVQNQPGSHLVLVDCVRSWPNGPGPEASRCVCQIMAKRTRSGSKPVCVSDHGQTDPVRKQAGVCVRSWPNGPGPEASRCVCQIMAKRTRSGSKPVCVSDHGQTDPVRKQAGVQESSGPLLASASQPIRTACLLGRIHRPTCYWKARVHRRTTQWKASATCYWRNNAFINQSVSISLLPRVKYNVHARGMRYGVDSVHNHTHVHNNISRLTMYIL